MFRGSRIQGGATADAALSSLISAPRTSVSPRACRWCDAAGTQRLAHLINNAPRGLRKMHAGCQTLDLPDAAEDFVGRQLVPIRDQRFERGLRLRKAPQPTPRPYLSERGRGGMNAMFQHD